MADKKLKILCLHGYRQSDKIFGVKTGALRKGLKKLASFTYFTAPHNVLATTNADDSVEGQHGWWFSTPKRTYYAMDTTDTDLGFQESMDVFRQFCLDTGPYDGVLGFSQGASMVSIICMLQQRKALDIGFNFKFAILLAGFRSLLTCHQQFYDAPIQLPSLHVFGRTDRVIPMENSEELTEHFVDPVIHIHDGGHFVAASAPQRKAYNEFFQKFIS